METLSADKFKEKYGGIATTSFNANKKQDSLFSDIKNSIGQRGAKNTDILEQPSSGFGDDVTKGFEVAGNTAGAVGDVAGAALSRVPMVGKALNAAGGALKKGFNAVTDKLGGTKFFQEAAAGLETGNNLEKGLRVGAASGEVANNILGADVGAGAIRQGAKAAGEVPGAVASAAEKIPTPNLGKAGEYAKGAMRDVIPTSQGIIDHQIARALDLTPGDLSKLESSTGNQVGRWLADNNLIGTNKQNTQGLIQGFFKQNYDAVRSEIGKVDRLYSPTEVPRFGETLNAIFAETNGKLGLEKVNSEITKLLKKEQITLSDVQRTKELLDEHFNLYKATGDVAQGVSKEGLAKVRTELKDFIENQVKENTGSDIRQLNNNVATAKGLNDAITTRSPRGLTRANLTTRDAMMGLGLTYFGTPLLGLAAIVVGKVATSPTARLRLARFLDSRTDAYRKQVSEDLQKGVVPAEVQKVVESDELSV